MGCTLKAARVVEIDLRHHHPRSLNLNYTLMISDDVSGQFPPLVQLQVCNPKHIVTHHCQHVHCIQHEADSHMRVTQWLLDNAYQGTWRHLPRKPNKQPTERPASQPNHQPAMPQHTRTPKQAGAATPVTGATHCPAVTDRFTKANKQTPKP